MSSAANWVLKRKRPSPCPDSASLRTQTLGDRLMSLNLKVDFRISRVMFKLCTWVINYKFKKQSKKWQRGRRRGKGSWWRGRERQVLIVELWSMIKLWLHYNLFRGLKMSWEKIFIVRYLQAPKIMGWHQMKMLLKLLRREGKVLVIYLCHRYNLILRLLIQMLN